MARYMVEGRIILVLTRPEAKGLLKLAGNDYRDAEVTFKKDADKRAAQRAYAALASACGPPIA